MNSINSMNSTNEIKSALEFARDELKNQPTTELTAGCLKKVAGALAYVLKMKIDNPTAEIKRTVAIVNGPIDGASEHCTPGIDPKELDACDKATSPE